MTFHYCTVSNEDIPRALFVTYPLTTLSQKRKADTLDNQTENIALGGLINQLSFQNRELITSDRTPCPITRSGTKEMRSRVLFVVSVIR
jgi:hypothetical protein